MTQIHINLLVAFLTGVVGPIVVMLVRDWLEKRKEKKDPIKEELEVATSVVDKLDDLVINMKCDRAWLIQFHNGGHFYPTGKSIQKYSMFYEVTSPETESVQAYYQNIPVNLFSKVLKDVTNKGYVAISDFHDPHIQNYGMQYIAEDFDIKSQYIFAVHNISGKLIGCLGIDYTKKKHKLDTTQTNQMQIISATIGGILFNHLQKK
jgi:hypothetical protein